MSGDNRAWTWRHAILRSGLPATTRHVLLTLSCFMNDVGGGCYPTQEQLAEATGLTDRAVRTHLEKAEELGWLGRTEHGFRGQRWRNHEYFAKWPGLLDVDEGAEPRSGPPGKRSGTSFPKVRKDVPPILPDNSNTPLPPEKPTEGEDQDVVSDGFDAIRDLWPESALGHPDKARAAFDALTDDQRAVVAKAVRTASTLHYRRFLKRGEAVPVLATALRSLHWSDFIDAPTIDDDGHFIVTPNRPEWRPWLKHIEKSYGKGARDRTEAAGRFLPPTRWPEGARP